MHFYSPPSVKLSGIGKQAVLLVEPIKPECSALIHAHNNRRSGGERESQDKLISIDRNDCSLPLRH